jgi:predicted GNAT superfamily acetyltransferase
MSKRPATPSLTPLEVGIRPLREADLRASPSLSAALLRLNNNHAVELSWLDEPGFRKLVGCAWFAAHAGVAHAMMIALRQDAAHSGENFLWFRKRYPSFVYVDRVIVAPEARGFGLALHLYDHLFERARAARIDTVTCEVNLDPPNPASMALHRKLGFLRVRRARLPNRKTVAYLAKRLS